MDTTNDAPALSSRWCRNRYLFSSNWWSAQIDLTCLEQLFGRSPVRVPIPAADWTVDLIRRYRARLERLTRIALVNEPALGSAINKKRTLAIARQLGLAIQRGTSVRSASHAPAAVREVGLPAIVKPLESWVQGEQRGERITSQLFVRADQARHAGKDQTHTVGSVHFQQCLTGRREVVSFLYAGGTVYARFAQWARHTGPPSGGAYVLRQSIPIPADVGSQAERLVRELEMDGNSEMEFRRDSTGPPYLMEINSRRSASVEVAEHAVADFPNLIYQWASGGRIDVIKDYRGGVWKRYLGGDSRTTVNTIMHQGKPGVPSPAAAIRDFCASFFMPALYDYWDWKDPLPAHTAIAGFVRSAFTTGALTRVSRQLVRGR